MIMRISWRRDVGKKGMNYCNYGPVYKRGDGIREKQRYYSYEAGWNLKVSTAVFPFLYEYEETWWGESEDGGNMNIWTSQPREG